MYYLVTTLVIGPTILTFDVNLPQYACHITSNITDVMVIMITIVILNAKFIDEKNPDRTDTDAKIATTRYRCCYSYQGTLSAILNSMAHFVNFNPKDPANCQPYQVLNLSSQDHVLANNITFI